MKNILKNFALNTFWGLLIVLGGLLIYLLSAMAIGYLPYSDRPGPSWQKGIHISWAGTQFILDFLPFLGIYILGELIILFWLFRLFRLIGYDKTVFSVFGGLMTAFLTAYLTLGIGWYIALDFSTVVVGGILGGLHGAILFPKYLK